jgi:hypothetical protein
VAFPTTQLDVKVEIALGADITSTSLSFSWTDVTAYVLVRDLIVITRGRGDEYSTSPPATCRLTVDNTDGRWCRTNPTGAWYGQLSKNTPLRVRVNGGAGYVNRFTGFIDELPPRWDKSGNHAYAPITASGLLRRVRQGGALRSALFRAHTDGYFSQGAPVAYWPCEDPSGSQSIASGIAGPAMTYGGDDIQLAGDSSIKGSEPLIVLGDNGLLTGVVPTYASSTTWAIRWVMKIPTGDAGVLLNWFTPSGTGNVKWRLSLDSGTDVVHIAAFNSAGTDVIADAGVAIDGIRDKQIYIEVNATQNGTGIDWDYNIWLPTGTGGGATGTLASSTIANVTQVQCFAGTGALGNSTIGHIAVATDVLYGASFDGADGFDGEGTWARFQRLLFEENLAWGNSGAATLMGPQPTASLQSQLAEIEATEAAPVYDGTNGLINLTQRQDRYNSTVALTLDFDSGQVAEPPEPTDDDQQLKNDITVSRSGGSSARATQTTGPNNTSAVGVYTHSVTVNTQTDTALPYHAQWLRHLGTVDELRFPRVDMNFARATTKITDWLACDINSRIQLTNPPSQLAPDTIDLILEGYTETLGPYTWAVAANCSPATPWQVFEVEDDDLGRVDTGGSYLLADYSSAATSLLVATSSGPQWSTTAPPYAWHIAGEKLTVTSMASNAVSYVGVGTASHAVDGNVTPSMPASIAKGDLLLCWAATRGTAGSVGLPSGWESLVQLSNVRLIGKIYDGSESAPTIVMTSSGGNDCSAQIAAWRNAQLSTVVASTSQTNGSAQDIAVPALTGTDRASCLIVACGWKQDDWTSVAALTGMTEIAEFVSTAGADHGLVWDYVVQTSPAATSALTFTVTGGASAQSKAVVVALAGDVQTATVTRAVNGVSKAQAANAAVSLWKPGSGGLAL